MTDLLPPDSSAAFPSGTGDRDSGRGGLRFVLETARSIILALLVFLVVRTTLLEAFTIPTGSMEGTLLVGDFLLVNKAVYGAEIPGLGLAFPALAEPRRGEVIVFNPPHEPRKHYVKRVVGAPGDTVAMRQKRLYRNGDVVEEPYARHSHDRRDAVHPGMTWQGRHLAATVRSGRYRPSRDNWGPIVVPEGKFFVLGDNRDNSEDSRYWGFVDRSAVRGRPWVIYYSHQPGADGKIPVVRSVRWTRIGERIE
jgi:signal peptidase I